MSSETDVGVFTIGETIRVAQFNASLNRGSEGALIADLSDPTDTDNPGVVQAQTVAEIIQRVDPDIILINEFDYDDQGPDGTSLAAQLFRDNFLEVGQNGADPVTYDHAFIAPSNTGVQSGIDLNGDGEVGGPNDAFGFGFFPGQFGMLVLSKHDIVEEDVRTFQEFLWTDLPDARLPDDPETPEPGDFLSDEALEVFRLSSKSHWDVPISVNGEIIHALTFHPTPPVFDGPEDLNGLRNADEIRFWQEYVTPGSGEFIVDDNGGTGGLTPGDRFVVMGDFNADPNDGDSTDLPTNRFLATPTVDLSITPSSLGGLEQAILQGGLNDEHAGSPLFDTADFNDAGPGNLRVDFVAPSASGLEVTDAAVFWPLEDDPLFRLVGTFDPDLGGFPSSDHRLVYVDMVIEGTGGAEYAFPSGVSAGDTDQTSTVLLAQTNVPGTVKFLITANDPAVDQVFEVEAEVTDILVPAKITVDGLVPGTDYAYSVTNAAGDTIEGSFRTANEIGVQAGLTFGVSGDWRGELAPYPSIANADEADLDFFIKLGDTIYADFPSPEVPAVQATTIEEFRAKHAEGYGERFGLNSWAELQASTSILATIDDHEVINNFSGGAPIATDDRFEGDPATLINDSELYELGIQSFQEYNAIRDEIYGETGDPRTESEQKLYRANDWGTDAATFVLDARSFRDPGLPPVADPTDPVEIGAFLQASFDPTRTMLGDAQLDDLKADLLAAQEAGTTWKFIVVPEPIQNFGVVEASDRFEGYAAERTEILSFIDDNDIDNVVFIAADFHGTLVNNVTYQTDPTGPQINSGAIEVVTGSVAYDPPFGPELINLAVALDILSPEEQALFNLLPIAPDSDDEVNDRDDFVKAFINEQLTAFGYDPLGLDAEDNLPVAQDSVDAELLQGDYVAVSTFGWTQFDIDAETQQLTVTTYGIDPYSEFEIADPAMRDEILAREPSVVSQFTLQPQSEDGLEPGAEVAQFLNTVTGVPFLTASVAEAAFVTENLPAFETRDPAFAAAGEDGAPVFRFFNTQTGSHFYTTSEAERDAVLEDLPGFTFEGEAFDAFTEQAAGSIPVFRVFIPETGAHYFTASAQERDEVLAGFDSAVDEGTAFYAVPLIG
ncbi:MAG: hypothetical protein GVY13_00495 [Alphaproteobacteria bacterium]|jgi:phosphodiesterase/alkaline phosphatase D-like protein|nr:hypothetical protein [Alphaproteobacteria bacterium]